MPVGRGIGNFHAEPTPSVASIEGDTKHIHQVFNAVMRNDAINRLDEARAVVPALEREGLLTRLAPIGNQYTATVAKNIGRVPFYHKATKEYLELGTDPFVAKAVNNANTHQVEGVLRAIQSVNRIFQAGVTTMNPTFLPGHFSRTISSVVENLPEGEAGHMLPYMATGLISMLFDNPGAWLTKHATHAEGIDKRTSELVLQAMGKLGYRPQALEEFKTYGPYQQGLTFLGDYGAEGAKQALSRAGIPTPASMQSRLDKTPVLGGAAYGIGKVLSAPFHLMEAGFEFADELPRFAAYQILRKGGAAPEQAGLDVANMGVNFRRSGDLVRKLNMLVPLLNAREQGVLTSLHGIWENPHRFMWRAAWLVGMPEMALYAHNRDVMGDMYDQISPEQKMANYIIGTGAVVRDRQGREQPFYFQVPKTPLVQILSAPLIQYMDAVYHHSAGALPEEYKEHFPDHPYFKLPEQNRVNQSAQHLLLGMLGRISPTDTTGANIWHDLVEPVAILSLQPMVGTAVQMWANKDHFTGRPIVPPELEDVPPEYRYTPNTTESAKALSRALGGTPLGDFMKLQEPAQLEHLVQSYLGGSGMFVLTGADQFWTQLTQHGLVPPPDYAPRSWADLKLPNDLPEDLKWQLMQELDTPEHQPWGPEFMKRVIRFYGTGGSANSDLARASRMGEEQRRVVEQTRGYHQEYARARADMQETLRKKFENPGPNETPDDLRKFENDQYDILRGRGIQLREKYPQAKLDPREYRAFMDQMPGMNTQELVAALPKLPANLTPEMITQVLQQTNDPNPLKRYQLQQQALTNLSRQYQIPVNVLKDHAAAAIAGRTLPEIPVPNVGIQLARDEYFRPPDIDLLTATPKELAQARDKVVERLSGEWGVSRESVLEWLNTSFRDPFSSSPMQKSREAASALSHELYDTQKFPPYVTPEGKPYGQPDQYPAWDLLLAQHQASGVPREQWPAFVQGLDAARRYADVFKDLYISQDPRYPDYQMWYGVGRQMPVQNWTKFQAGQIPKYTTGTPQQWSVWDTLQKIYAKLPAGDPHKAALLPVVTQLRKLAVPHWRDLLRATEEQGASLPVG